MLYAGEYIGQPFKLIEGLSVGSFIIKDFQTEKASLYKDRGSPNCALWTACCYLVIMRQLQSITEKAGELQ